MTSIQRAGRGWFAAGIAVLGLACDSSNDDGPTGNTGSISIVVGPATTSIEPGSSTFVTVTLTRAGGFSGTVTVSIAGLPDGVSATMAPGLLSGNAVTSRIDLTAAASAALANATVTVTASAQGVTTATASFQLAVTAPPDYALVVSPATLTLAAGATGNVDIQLNRTNFSGPITLALLNPAAGITATFNPTPAPAATSAMALNVAASVAPGSYQVTIQGTAAGVPSRSVAVSLTVVPAPPSGNNVTYYFCNVDDVPDFLAYQDGTGPWQAVTPDVTGGTTTFSFNISQGRGAVLATYPYTLSTVARARGSARASAGNHTTSSGSSLSSHRRSAARRSLSRTQAAVGDAYDTHVVYGTTSELSQDGLDACATQEPPAKTVHASVVGVTAGQYGVFSLGSATGIFDGAQATNPFTLHEVPAGPQDLVGSRITTPGQPPDRLILLRNLNVPDGGTLPQAIDYNGPASVVPATATATVTGAAGGDQLEIFVDLITPKGSNQLWFDLAPSAVTARPWAGFNSASMVPGDLHRIWVFATRSGDPLVQRVMTKIVGPVANQTMALGADLAAPATSVAAGGSYPRYGFQGPIPGDYDKGLWIEMKGEDDGSNGYYLFASGAYLGASGNPAAYDIVMPDVAALPGFPVDARLTAGVNVVLLSVHGFTGPGFYEPRLAPGAESRGAYRALTINVP